MIDLMHMDDLARKLGYASANRSFRERCVSMRITPVPGRRGFYDPNLVRRRLDEAQGLLAAPAPADERPASLADERRARRGAA